MCNLHSLEKNVPLLLKVLDVIAWNFLQRRWTKNLLLVNVETSRFLWQPHCMEDANLSANICLYFLLFISSEYKLCLMTTTNTFKKILTLKGLHFCTLAVDIIATATAIHNRSGNTHFAFVCDGCQMVTYLFLGLCDWGLRNTFWPYFNASLGSLVSF